MSIKNKLEYFKPRDYEISEHGNAEFAARAMQILGHYAESIGVKKFHIERTYEGWETVAVSFCCKASPHQIKKIMSKYEKELEFMKQTKQ